MEVYISPILKGPLSVVLLYQISWTADHGAVI